MRRFLQEISHNMNALASVFDSIKDLVFLMEADNDCFRYVYVNKSAKKVLNIQDSILGKYMRDVLTNDHANSLRDKYQQVISTSQPVHFEEILETLDGEFIGSTSANPILSEEGSCKYVLAIVRDVTEKRCEEQLIKETKKQLEKEHNKLQSLIEDNSDAVFELDLEGKFTNINKMVTYITGYEDHELIGQPFSPLIVKEYLEESISNFNNAKINIREEYETWIYHRNGHKVHLSVKNIPTVVDGEVVSVYGIAKDITVKNQLEQRLKESEQRYKSLYENHPDGIFSLDIKGKFMSGNPSIEKLTGYEINDLLGSSFRQIIDAKDFRKAYVYFNKAIKKMRPERYEVGLINKNGERIEVSVMSIPIIVEDKVVGVYGLAKDITEQKLAQEALIKTKEELEIFWNYTVDPVFLISDEEIIKANPAFEKVFGFSEQEIVEGTGSFMPPNMEFDNKFLNQRIKNGEIISGYETKRITKSGKLLDVIASYTPVKDDKGKIIGATAFYKDITDRIQTQRELQKSEEKFRLITENSFDITKLIDPTGIVEYTSPANEKILGYKDEDTVGQPFTKYAHPEDKPMLEAYFESILKERKLVKCEYRVQSNNDKWLWMEVVMTPIIEKGEIKQLLSICRDITERKKYRDELAKMAFYDYLTGLPNRRVFRDRLDMAISQAKRSEKKVAVMMLDGREFKKVNDTYGHDAGDAVIKEMAKRLQNCVRETDTVARFGGDEMGIILPELDSQELAEEVAKRIIGSFNDPLYFNNHKISIGAGIGISIYPDHTQSKRKLIKLADEALYEAKESTQSDYQVYE